MIALKRIGSILGGWMAVWALCGISHANGIITDPRMSILEDQFSDPFNSSTIFAPDGNGGGFFGFFNPTGVRITELTLTTTIATGLDPSVIAVAFACNDASSGGGFANPFFLHCGFSYVGVTGVLTIAFWGTNPLSEADQFLLGNHEGIPPLLPGCAATPDAPGCAGLGHFAFDLNDSLTVTGGGWSFEKNPNLFNPGEPVFTVGNFSNTFGFVPTGFGESAVPEPGTIILMGGALLGLCGLKYRRRGAKADPENRS
jgi:hypothetical protein